MENTSKPVPQCTNNQHGEILPTTRDVRNKPPTYTTRTSNTRRQINYESMNWDGNNTSYMPLPSGRQQVVLEQFSINGSLKRRMVKYVSMMRFDRDLCTVSLSTGKTRKIWWPWRPGNFCFMTTRIGPVLNVLCKG